MKLKMEGEEKEGLTPDLCVVVMTLGMAGKRELRLYKAPNIDIIRFILLYWALPI